MGVTLLEHSKVEVCKLVAAVGRSMVVPRIDYMAVEIVAASEEPGITYTMAAAMEGIEDVAETEVTADTATGIEKH